MDDLRRFGWFLPTFLYSQFFRAIPIPSTPFTDQNVIITGSNVGLGLEAARHVARLNAKKLILAVRSVEKGEAARQDILDSLQKDGVRTEIEVWQVDMAKVESVKALAKRAAGLERLDAVVLNAGVMNTTFTRAEDGMEMTVAVNTVNTLLLSLLLVPVLKKSAERIGKLGRLTIVGSDTMYVASLVELNGEGESLFERLNDEKTTSVDGRYALSKQLLYWTFRDICKAHPVDETKVVMSVVTPGLCNSTLLRTTDEPRLKITAIKTVMGTLARTTEMGGRALVLPVESGVPTEYHGKFLMDAKVAYDGYNVVTAQGERLAKKWNAEVYAKLNALSPGCTNI